MTLATAGLVAAGIVTGVLLGILRRASVRLLQAPTIRWAALGLAAAIACICFAFLSIERVNLYTAVALGALVVFAVANAHLVGMPIVAFGLALNLAGVAINDGYSVDRQAAQNAELRDDLAANRHFDDRTDPAWFLGQVVPLPPLREVVSFGDLIVSLGLLDTAYRATRKRRRPSISLTSSARVGLTTLAASSRRIDDKPVIDLRLANRATWFGYAQRPTDLTSPAPSATRAPTTTAGSRRGPHRSAGSSTPPDPNERPQRP